MGLESYIGISKPEEKKEIRVVPYESKVVFEPKAVYCGNNKKQYTFDESLKALRKRGYERHPRPAEACDLICRSLEGRLQPEQQVIADDMLNNYEEWLSLAMQRKENQLHCYLDPENIFWDSTTRTYNVRGGKLKHSGEKVYDIPPVYDWFGIKKIHEVSPELVEILWSRPYAILPENIRLRTVIHLPPSGNIWPIGRDYFGYFDIYCVYYYIASRGVRVE